MQRLAVDPGLVDGDCRGPVGRGRRQVSGQLGQGLCGDGGVTHSILGILGEHGIEPAPHELGEPGRRQLSWLVWSTQPQAPGHAPHGE